MSDDDFALMPESPVPTRNTHLRSREMSPNTQMEQEKRLRREIANSNERRRMQSINTGFQTLKILIPHSCGEKLSKACILQRAADHIKSLENEKLKLQSQNEQFRILIKSFQIDSTTILQSQRHPSIEQPIISVSTPTMNKQDEVLTKLPIKPSQRTYKTNSLDQANEKSLVIVERCQLRTQSVDTPINMPSSRPNLQSIVEAIRHLEGDDVYASISPTSTPIPTTTSTTTTTTTTPSTKPVEELPAPIKAMIEEKFSHSNNNSLLPHEIEFHHKPPKKRKITFNEDDESLLQKQEQICSD